MTNGPKLRVGQSLLPGVLAVALFVLMALVVFNTPFGSMQGFPDGISITSELGYALFDLTALQSTEGAVGDTEQFLVSFFLAAIVLDAALDAALVLAKREEGGEPVSALSTTSSRTSAGTGSSAGANAGSRPTAADGGVESGADASANARDDTDTDTDSTGGDDA